MSRRPWPNVTRPLVPIALYWSTDFPHPATCWPNSQKQVISQFAEAGIPDVDRDKIIRGNALKTFGLEINRLLLGRPPMVALFLQVTAALSKNFDREVNTMAGVLADLRVLDLSWGIAGPMATMLLADNGADVTKIEPPGGDPFRSQLGYKVWQRGKRSAVLDLKNPLDKATFLTLAKHADILVESFRPGVTQRLGIDFSQHYTH